MSAPPPSPATSPGNAPGAVPWPDPARAGRFAAWLARIAPMHRLAPASLRIASADASFRRYLRIDAAPRTSFIVMDAPPDKEDCRPFVKVAELMLRAGLHAPRVLEWDQADGFMLLSDLGTKTMIDALDPADAEASRPLYIAAVDALVAWQLASRTGVLPPYDAALLQRELSLFPDWYIAKHRGIELSQQQRAVLDSQFALIVERNLDSAAVYVHRDFMPRNLMMPSRGDVRLGVLDFQDAVQGPITYDIACLMRDAFISWDEAFVLDITVRYWQKAQKAGLPVGDDFGEFYRAVEWMGLQRHLKVAGIFARLTLRDGKPKYLADTPRFIGYIRATASRYRELGPLLRLVDEIEGTQAAEAFSFGRL